MNWRATSAESMPPMPRIGKPGNIFAMLLTAFNPMGLVALPETPPYVVSFLTPTAGHGLPAAFRPIRPETVLMADTPSALPDEVKNRRFHIVDKGVG